MNSLALRQGTGRVAASRGGAPVTKRMALFEGLAEYFQLYSVCIHLLDFVITATRGWSESSNDSRIDVWHSATIRSIADT